jgi:hypothetical protein
MECTGNTCKKKKFELEDAIEKLDKVCEEIASA